MTNRNLGYGRIVAVLIVSAVALLATGCNRTSSRTSTKAQALPKRIISLTPSNTEILFALGVGDKVVGDTKYCDYPPQAKKIPKIGDMNVSIETVIGLKPDLIVAHKTLNNLEISKLQRLGLNVLAIDPKNFSGLISDIKLVGNRTGAIAKANELTKSMERSIESVKTNSNTSSKPKVLVVIQTSPLWVAGTGTFVDEMISISHGQNVAYDGKSGFNTFSTETAIARNPDVIVVTRPEDRDFLLKNAAWSRTRAGKLSNIVVIDPDLLLRAGPRLTQGLNKLSEAVRTTATPPSK